MKVWITVLKVFGRVWLALAAIVILIGIAGTWIKHGFSAVQDLMSPFNLWNDFAIVVTLAPGLLAMHWADKLRQKQLDRDRQVPTKEIGITPP